MTEAQMLNHLAKAVERAGGVRAFARLAGVAPSYVSNALRGGVAIGDTLLNAAGLERIVSYRRLLPTPTRDPNE